MNSLLSLIGAFALALALCAASEVVILNNQNFEHLTQASSGATTGDWLVKFYAPWCGHCKKLEPVYDDVAAKLKGEVNVAKVDVTQNRELGTRFDIKGFPTLLLLSKGKAYTYKGRRTVDDIAEFAKGGYQIHEPLEVQPPAGMFGEIGYIYRHAYKQASEDLRKGNFFTVDVLLTFLPLLFVVLLVVVLFAPTPTPPRPKRRIQEEREDADDEDDDADAGVTEQPSQQKTVSADENVVKRGDLAEAAADLKRRNVTTSS